MIVYHFTSAEYGISNIANKRLKVAEIDKLNDPYDLMAFDTSDRGIRNAFNSTKAAFAEIHGITCFSRKLHRYIYEHTFNNILLKHTLITCF